MNDRNEVLVGQALHVLKSLRKRPTFRLQKFIISLADLLPFFSFGTNLLSGFIFLLVFLF